ncbi:hypothetical protein C8R31_101657 [Nitrosospira sp. Nsp2]|uniref:hypothetical protein n=1 Tax=Nitrosospira sp. Nsp2 TaxID=136548 RepID=UPI000D31737D|nr:hypothetical protein [Nitrosospira sp. Nsp2]PTR17493.1 hypothetical protein C8R31_101657 [Nitrosospira sp. Nsp2]
MIPLLKRHLIQPQYSVELDPAWKDRVAFASITGLPGSEDIVTRSFPAEGSTVGRRPSQKGLASYTGNVAHGLVWSSLRPIPSIFATGMTFLMYAKPVAGGTLQRAFFVGDELPAVSSQYNQACFAFNCTASGTASSGLFSTFEYNFGFQGTGQSSAGVVDGEWHVFIATRPAGFGSWTLYRDGINVTSSGTPANGVILTDGCRVHVHPGATQGYPDDAELAVILKEYTTPEDALRLSNNPWQIYRQERRLVIPSTGGGAASVTGAGQIASAEAIGQPSLTVNIAAAAVTSAEAFGSSGIAATVAASSIASAEAAGSPAIVASVTASGLAGAEALGSAAIAATVDAAGIASAEAVGSPAVGGAAAAEITAAGITSAEALGSPALGVAVEAAAIASAEALGQPNVGAAAADVTGVGQIATAEAIGAPVVGIAVAGSGVSSAEAFGSPALAVQVTGAGGIATAEAVGAPLVGELVAAEITGAGGIASSEAFGTPTVFPLVPYTGTGFQLGSGHRPLRSRRSSAQLTQNVQPHRIAAAGIESQERFGYPTLEWGGRSRMIRDEEFLLGRAA